MRLGMFVCLSACLSVRARNSKTISPIDLIFYTIVSIPAWLGPPLRLGLFRSGSEYGQS